MYSRNMLGLLFIVFLVNFNCFIQAVEKSKSKDDLLVVSVINKETDTYYRFIRSLNVYGYKYEVILIEIYVNIK